MDVLVEMNLFRVVDGNISKQKFCSVTITGESMEQVRSEAKELIDLLNKMGFHVE